MSSMYMLFTDETNTTYQPAGGVKFFAYGGLIVPDDQLMSLDAAIESIRKKYGFNSTDSFKFDTRTRPKDIPIESFSKAKSEVIQKCIETGCKFLVYVVLHEIAKKQGVGKTIKWGADHIIGKFNFFLTVTKRKGIVFVDRLTDVKEYQFLTEKFVTGLQLDTGKAVPLNNIRLFASTCNNASHLSSAMDIILGSFRYCINQPYNLPVAKTIMKSIVKLFWADPSGDGNINPFEKGLTLRPKNIERKEYQLEYENLIKYINSLLAE